MTTNHKPVEPFPTLTIRQALELQYTTQHGTIISPGKFQGEGLYVPFFWELGLSGFADADEGSEFIFTLADALGRRFPEWPELDAFHYITLWEDHEGFVHSSLVELPNG